MSAFAMTNKMRPSVTCQARFRSTRPYKRYDDTPFGVAPAGAGTPEEPFAPLATPPPASGRQLQQRDLTHRHSAAVRNSREFRYA